MNVYHKVNAKASSNQGCGVCDSSYVLKMVKLIDNNCNSLFRILRLSFVFWTKLPTFLQLTDRPLRLTISVLWWGRLTLDIKVLFVHCDVFVQWSNQGFVTTITKPVCVHEKWPGERRIEMTFHKFNQFLNQTTKDTRKNFSSLQMLEMVI